MWDKILSIETRQRARLLFEGHKGLWGRISFISNRNFCVQRYPSAHGLILALCCLTLIPLCILYRPCLHDDEWWRDTIVQSTCSLCLVISKHLNKYEFFHLSRVNLMSKEYTQKVNKYVNNLAQ